MNARQIGQSLAIATGRFGSGDRSGACLICREILASDPEFAPAIHLLALDAACSGNGPAALADLDRALALRQEPLWYRDLASVLGYLDRWNEAQDAMQKALALGPPDADSLALLGRCFLELGEIDRSLESYSQALALEPESLNALIGLARARIARSQWGDALAALHRCVEAHSSADIAYELMAGVERHLKQFDKEAALRRKVIALRPGEPAPLARLGLALYETGDLDGCIAALKETIRTAPHESHAHSSLLCAYIHHHAQTPASLIERHRDWARLHCSPSNYAGHLNAPEPHRKLRVGYLTGECMLNPTIFFFLPILKRHDASRFESFCYHTRPGSDRYTALYREAAQNWRDVSQLSTSAVAALVREDCIDILIDVSGHFPFGALPVFALRPAPVQVSTANYPCTTGLKAMEYILTDEWICPPGAESMYTETPLRVPGGYFAWEPQVTVPDSPPSPAAVNGAVTFCLLQRPPKVNSAVLDAIAEVLRRVPDSRLLFHQGSRDLDHAAGPAVTKYTQEFFDRGIDAARIRFLGGVPLDQHLTLLSEADIALDTFPYSGQTTTCECLYMGVPVITLAGTTHASRVSASILHRAGYGAFVATSICGYVETAVALAHDPALQAHRRRLRKDFLASPVCDPALVTSGIESILRASWRTWCERSHFDGTDGLSSAADLEMV